MGDGFVWCIIGGLAIAGLYNWYDKPDETPLLVSRYRLQEIGGHNFLLDTTDGEVWRFVYSEKNKDGVPVNWYWEKTDNSLLDARKSLKSND